VSAPARPSPYWRQVVTHQVLEVHRTGWRGVWDALVAACSGRPRLTVPQAFEFSVWVRGEEPVRLVIHNPEVTQI